MTDRARTIRHREVAAGIASARQHQPTRQFRRDPIPVGTIDADTIDAVAVVIADRIRGNRHALECGSFVLVDVAGRAYVLSEGALTTRRIVDERADQLVGLYAADHRNGTPGLIPKPARILEDLNEHLRRNPQPGKQP